MKHVMEAVSCHPDKTSAAVPTLVLTTWPPEQLRHEADPRPYDPFMVAEPMVNKDPLATLTQLTSLQIALDHIGEYGNAVTRLSSFWCESGDECGRREK